ncbi:MAG: hypothetical protein ACERKJ_11325 [Candidatus Dadabacteria bacterium]
MPIGGNKDNKEWAYLDERECFTLWNDLSSLSKAQKELVRRGVKNPKTGKYPTNMSIRVAALRWAMKNPEQARIEIAESAGGEWAEDRTHYYQWLNKEVAFKILSEKRYDAWKEENADTIRA